MHSSVTLAKARDAKPRRRQILRDAPIKRAKEKPMELLTPAEVADYLRAHTRSLSRWRTEGAGPPFVRVGSLIRYPADGLEDWLSSRSARSVAEYRAKSAERKGRGTENGR